jgi:hypothetical protein
LRVRVRDIALIVACLCVLLWTVLALFLGGRIWQAEQPATEPTSCERTADNPWPC